MMMICNSRGDSSSAWHKISTFPLRLVLHHMQLFLSYISFYSRHEAKNTTNVLAPKKTPLKEWVE